MTPAVPSSASPLVDYDRGRLDHAPNLPPGWVDAISASHFEAILGLPVALANDADLFEVKDALDKKGERYHVVRDGALVLGNRRGEFVRETTITSSARASVDEAGFTFQIRLPAHGRWETRMEVIPCVEQACSVKYGHGSFAKPKPNMRESLITGYQALPFVTNLARTTLRVLAARQGQQIDDFRDEEPGKILHELRVGELTVFGERPHSPYYDTADALFLVLLEETERWTGDAALVRELETATSGWVTDGSSRWPSTDTSDRSTAHVQHRPPAVEWHRRRRQGAALVEQLMSDRLFSGWGVRTMAEGEAA